MVISIGQLIQHVTIISKPMSDPVQPMLQATEAIKEEDEEAGWNLEDEAGFGDEEEEDAQPSVKPAGEAKAEEGMDLEEGGDEIDPLDAFMADNEARVGPVKTEDTTAAPQGNTKRSWLALLLAASDPLLCRM